MFHNFIYIILITHVVKNYFIHFKEEKGKNNYSICSLSIKIKVIIFHMVSGIVRVLNVLQLFLSLNTWSPADDIVLQSYETFGSLSVTGECESSEEGLRFYS